MGTARTIRRWERERAARTLAAAVAFGLLAAAGGTDEPARAQLLGPPNVLLIVTDDQRSLRSMPKTRSIFAADGTRFPDAYVTTPLCCPSRASILSGRYAHNHGVLRNGDADEFDPTGALPDLLQQAGYRTAVIGKYLNDWPLERTPPHFDEFLLTEDSTYYDGVWNRNGDIERTTAYSTRVMTRAATEFVEAQMLADSPWFLQIATVAPHRPFTPQRKYSKTQVKAFRKTPAHAPKASRGKPGFVREADTPYERGRTIRRQQLRTLMSVDDLVAEVFRQLDLTLQAQNTLVIFVSDNGMMWGEFGLKAKGVPYTPSIKVPMLMRWPAGSDAGAVDPRLVTNVDIAATILDATGAPHPEHPLDGRSLLDRGWSREHLLIEYWGNVTERRPWASLRTRRWQYVEHYVPGTGEQYFEELYDLRRDPWQVKNLLRMPGGDSAPDLERLESLLEAYKTCAGTTGAQACP